uniref:Uncharacterized protein n=1 Tax=Trichogramma kaykai TaxID=54128 RepID=A0ABD2X1I6_9HYME
MRDKKNSQDEGQNIKIKKPLPLFGCRYGRLEYIHAYMQEAVAAHPFGASSTSTYTCARKSIYGVDVRNACAAVPLRALENSLDMCCKATSRYAHERERERERQTLYDSRNRIPALVNFHNSCIVYICF